MSLRYKLLLPLLTIAALLAGYLYGVWIPRSLDGAQAEHLSRVQRHLDSVVEGLIPMLASGQLDAIHDNLGALKERNRDWIDIVLLDERERQLYPLISRSTAVSASGHGQETVERRIAFLGSPLGTLRVLVDFSELKEKDRLHHHELGAMLAGMVLVVLATLWATLEFAVSRPLHGLAGAARELAQQNFDVALPPGSHDEVGTLIDAFSSMRNDLRSNQAELLHEIAERRNTEAELARHRDHLEELVVERTHALEDRNRSLHKALELVRKTQNDLVESEKMASLGRLVAGFAHEINTPIGVAVGASSHALEASGKLLPLLDHDEIDETVLRTALAEIDQACALTYSNLARTADLVGRFKRTSVDQTRGEARLYNLEETLTDVVASLHDVLKRTPVSVVIDCPPDIALYGYPGALGQIVTNLVINSVRHGFDEGRQPGAIRIAAERQDEEIVIDYRDDGKGMDAATRGRVFEPFFTLARETGGTGLGLFICHNLATSELKGSIRCDSAPGAGVRFVLRYPANRAPAGPDQATSRTIVGVA